MNGSSPMAPDNAKGVRNVSLRFGLSDNETWKWATTPYAYCGASAQLELLDALASLTPNAGIKKANANKVKDFVNANPEVLLQGSMSSAKTYRRDFGKVNR